jgi:hypothetical protein
MIFLLDSYMLSFHNQIMSRFSVISLFTVVIAAVYLVWWFSPNQIVTRQTHKIISCIDVPQTATKTYRALKTNSFSNLLDKTVRCRVDIANYQSDFSRDRLVESHQMFVQNIDWATAKASNTVIEVIDDQNASAQSTIDFKVRTKKTESVNEIFTISMQWKKNADGKWLLTSLEMLGRN